MPDVYHAGPFDPAQRDRLDDETSGLNVTRTTGGDTIENGTITAFGYAPAYRRVLGAVVGVAIVLALTSYVVRLFLSIYFTHITLDRWVPLWWWATIRLSMLDTGDFHGNLLLISVPRSI